MGVEAIELPAHNSFIATGFQPQVGAGTTGRLHPLVLALIDAASQARSVEASLELVEPEAVNA